MSPVYAARIFAWQGQRDSNPRPAVLETATLPTELYPFRPEQSQIREPGGDFKAGHDKPKLAR